MFILFISYSFYGSTNYSSNCKACKEKLAPIKVLVKDFKKLQKEFLNRVLIRKDVFVRSNPTELENFRTMIKQTAPYDVVIDGLNVAFCSGKKKYNELANIVSILIIFVISKFKILEP